ncbi:hypothetical protein B0H12DRAFT_1144405 [Mycena haematopus]|nr:hypothetical protein B0H12DRAFT_1144405 [Mycena haematopus]
MHNQNDPPDDHDVRCAREYVKSTEIAWGNHLLADESHLAAAVAYEHSVIAARCGEAAAPPWFANALQVGLQDIKDGIEEIKEDITALTIRAVKVEALAAKTYNLQCGDGTARNFEVLPFRNGMQPSELALPALITSSAVRDLSDADSRKYYRGYKAGAVPDHAIRIQTIRSIIGCTVV